MAWTPKEVTVNSAGLTTASTSYVTGDQLGTEITVAAVAGANNGFGVITGIQILDKADVLGGVDAFFFSDSTTPASDNAAASWSDTDAAKAIAGSPVYLPAPVDVGGARIGGVHSIWVPFQSGSGHDDLFLDLVTRSGHTFFGAVGDIVLRINVLQYS